MIYFFYFNKEIFLCEFIFNVFDVVDKLCFCAFFNLDLYEGDGELCVCVFFDKDKCMLIIFDNGVGMICDEVIDYLGIIVKFGIKLFFEFLGFDQVKDSQLIGQFGVGFYFVFIVVDKVIVCICVVGEKLENGVFWELVGEGEYIVVDIIKEDCGIEIILYLCEGEDEFFDDWCVCFIISKYFDYIVLLVEIEKCEEKDGEIVIFWEKINKVQVLWICNKLEIIDEEYKEFYKYIVYDFNDLLIWSYNCVEGKQEYISLLYILFQVLWDMWNCDYKYGLKLYVQCVFIMDDVEQFMLNYLCFVCGLIDFSDLLLNVFCEIFQDSMVMCNLCNVLIKCVL